MGENERADLMNSCKRAQKTQKYQLLANEMGIAHWKVSVGYGVLQAVVGIGAWVRGLMS